MSTDNTVIMNDSEQNTHISMITAWVWSMIQEAEYKKQNILLAQIFCSIQIWARRFSSQQVLTKQINLNKIWARSEQNLSKKILKSTSVDRTNKFKQDLSKIWVRSEQDLNKIFK